MNRYKLSVIVCSGLILGLLASCADQQSRELTSRYVHSYLAWRPAAGTGLGLHEYDGKVTDYSKVSIEQEHQRLQSFRLELMAIDLAKLSPAMSLEIRALRSALERELFSFEVTKSYTHNPMTYTSVDLTTYAQRDFKPKTQRLESVIAILEKVPEIAIAGKMNLDEHLPRTYINTGIDQANGSADFFNEDLVTAFEDVKDPRLQKAFTEARAKASRAMHDFADWLKQEKLPKADDAFAIGRDGFQRMLTAGELLPQSPAEILAIGMRELKREQGVFAEAAARIDPSKSPIDVCHMVQQEHPGEKELLPESRKHLEAIRQFIIARDLVSFPSMVPVRLEETPKFERHASTAMMDTPGPFEKATQAFYYITPTESDWDAKKKEEWLSNFNFYTTDVTTIHEAYPGHYVQFLHLNASPATMSEKAFGSYAYIEGWAHYCERMVVDEGFPGNVDAKTLAKYRMAQAQDSLLRICRLCVSVQMHCQGMSVDQATKFFMDNGYFSEAVAREEANRGTHDPGYCFYTLGKLQFLKLREDYRRQEGNRFSLKAFHNALLDHGQPPIRLLREILLKDAREWDKTL